MTETMTEHQTLEVRRTLLQSVAEMGRGLKVISGFLKMGQFSMARDQIAAVDAMLQLHELLAQRLNGENRRLAKENKRLEALILDIDSALTERSVTLDGTAAVMIEQAMLPKSQRPEDFDRDDMLRYNAYSGEANAALALVRNMIAGKK